ncbi:MAG: YdcF family protein [Spirochaetaceae bacterium]|jgi:uncharacterized SAM-binding protein YcdF (DUF218 family)|nr:YdcF family protein [Spirochaetaceae bacterium]
MVNLRVKAPPPQAPGLAKALSGALGAVITLYITGISLDWGKLDGFNLAVGIGGLGLILFSCQEARIARLSARLPRPLKIIFLAAAHLGILSFVIVQGAIIYTMTVTAGGSAGQGADYLLVLGCQVDGDAPSVPLARRVAAAAAYLHENPRTKAIVSGGRGPGERVSEAEAMANLLIRRHNIPSGRILREERAASTLENLAFSDASYGLRDKQVVVVSSGYHLFRALALAKKQGYTRVSGLGSESIPLALPAYLLREYAAVMYYILRGYL